VDAFGTDEVTFNTLLKDNWFLGILLSHKPFLLDRCPVSVSLVGVPCSVLPAGCHWMVLGYYTVLYRQENRCFLIYLWDMSHSKDLISIFGVLERCSETSQPII
jgi:hypothetical protein